MTSDDLDFYCQRLHCRMTEAACIDRQRKAYRLRTEMGAGRQHDGAIYDIALSCLVCVDGEALRRRLGIPLTEKPRPAKKLPRVPHDGPERSFYTWQMRLINPDGCA
jgi:hypothetical protein